MKLFAAMRRKRILNDVHLTPGEKAERLYDLGYNCAQAVLQATCPSASEDLVRMADVFGGGIDDSKCLCGAVSGGTMSLSLQNRGNRASQLVGAFRSEFRTTCCKGLTAGVDWLSREHIERCRRLTGRTADVVAGLLEQ